MPPKNKFSREEVIQAGLEIVRRDGFAALTARSLAERLASSTKPIFGYFDTMDELHKAVLDAARQVYNRYVQKGLKEELAFRGVGIQYIQFAKEETKLFQILFMSTLGQQKSALEALPLLDENYQPIISSIQMGYGVGEDDSLVLYKHLWIYCHGIASLIVGGVCHFSDQEIEEQLTEVFIGLLIKLKSEGKNK